MSAARFQNIALPAVIEAVVAANIDQVEAAYTAATEPADRLRHESGYPNIKRLPPPTPPTDLQLDPVVAPAMGRFPKTATDRLGSAFPV